MTALQLPRGQASQAPPSGTPRGAGWRRRALRSRAWRLMNCWRPGPRQPSAGRRGQREEDVRWPGLHDRWPLDRGRVWRWAHRADRRAGHGRGGRRAGCAALDMTDRPMRSIVVIDSAVLDDKALDRWIGQARSYVAGLPPK